jgi:putative peptidoglycan lipid II flippase
MAHGRYLVASVRAAVQNVGLIAGIGAAVLTGNPLLLGWGFTLYSVAFALVGVVTLTRSGLTRMPERLAWREARGVLREFAALTAPLLLLPLFQQGALAVERVVASLIAADAVASLDYARTVSETGLALLAVPLGMAGLAELGRVDMETARRNLRRLVPLILAATVPCSAFLAINAQSVVRLLYARGRFGDDSVAITALILTGLAVGFWAHVAGYVMAKALSAHGRNRRVAFITALASAASVAVNVVAWRWLGPLALGLGASAFGLVLFACTAHALELGGALLRMIAVLAIGALAYVPIGRALQGPDAGALLVSVGGFVVFWVLFLGLAGVLPRLRLTPRLSAETP